MAEPSLPSLVANLLLDDEQQQQQKQPPLIPSSSKQQQQMSNLIEATQKCDLYETATTSAVGVELQEFWIDNPVGWLLTVEYQFRLAGIKNEETKFYHIASKLPKNINRELRDILKEEYQPGMLKMLKEKLVRRNIQSRLNRILDDGIGRRKPSQFMRDLLSLAQDDISISIVINAWQRQLPIIVAVFVRPLTKRIQESADNNEYSVEIMEEMLELADDIFNMSTNTASHMHINAFNRSRSSSTSSVNHQPRHHQRFNYGHSRRNKFNPNGPWCRNHFIYRNKCRRCDNPQTCKFSKFRRSTSMLSLNSDGAQ